MQTYRLKTFTIALVVAFSSLPAWAQTDAERAQQKAREAAEKAAEARRKASIEAAKAGLRPVFSKEADRRARLYEKQRERALKRRSARAICRRSAWRLARYIPSRRRWPAS